MTVSLKQIADLVSGEIVGDPGTVVSGVSSIPDAGPGDLVFAESSRLLEAAQNSPAAAVLTRHRAESAGKPLVVVSDPRSAFATVLKLFVTDTGLEPGVHESAHVSPTASLGDGVSVGFCCYIGDGVALGSNVTVLPFTFIGQGSKIGDNSLLYPHVTIYPGCTIGQRVILHSGAVIGADGFGYNQSEGEHVKIPHIGGVLIEDDVEVGANVTIDRSRTGNTVIGRGTKIDNLVHIAHNVKIGRNCIIIAQVGLSGSVTVGDNVILAGQVGVKDHVRIGENSLIGAKSGIISDIPPGSKIAGFPARRYGEQMRIWANLTRLPELAGKVRELEEKLDQLQSRLGEAGDPDEK